MDNKCEAISKILQENPEGLRFKSIRDLARLSEPTTSKHLDHLVNENKIHKKDLKYIWKPESIISYRPPYRLLKAEIELNLKESKENVHHRVTYTIQNQNENPLTCIAIHIWGDTPKDEWKELNTKFFQIKNDETIELYKNKQQPEYFVKNNPFEYNFQLRFQSPLYYNEIMQIIYEYDWDYATLDFTYDPSDNRPEEYIFKILYPKSKPYTINAFKVDASTLEKTPLPVKPNIKIEGTQKTFEWKILYDALQNYRVRVEWDNS